MAAPPPPKDGPPPPAAAAGAAPPIRKAQPIPPLFPPRSAAKRPPRDPAWTPLPPHACPHAPGPAIQVARRQMPLQKPEPLHFEALAGLSAHGRPAQPGRRPAGFIATPLVSRAATAGVEPARRLLAQAPPWCRHSGLPTAHRRHSSPEGRPAAPFQSAHGAGGRRRASLRRRTAAAPFPSRPGDLYQVGHAHAHAEPVLVPLHVPEYRDKVGQRPGHAVLAAYL